MTSRISFNFVLTTGQKYKISGPKTEKFKKILSDFLRTICPKQFSNITRAFYNGGPVNQEMSLEDNGILPSSSVLLLVNDVLLKSEMEGKREKDIIVSDPTKNSLSLNDYDKQLLIKLLDALIEMKEIQGVYFGKCMKANECVKKFEKCIHLHTSTHQHGLMVLISNQNWQCKSCSSEQKEDKEHDKNEATYYCTICNYKVCESCMSEDPNYNDFKKSPMEESYHEQIKLSSYTFPVHRHCLLYCRTARKVDKEWTCALCFKNYGNKLWSFYCTNCNYDICLFCSRKFLPKSSFTFHNGIKIDDHEHRLTYVITNINWECKKCNTKYDRTEPSYCCTKDKYFVCQKCMNKLSDETKYPIVDNGYTNNKVIDTITVDYHHHELMYCLTSRYYYKPTSWFCVECKKLCDEDEWSFYCSLCEYDLCYRCYKQSK